MTEHSIAGPDVDASYLKVVVDEGVRKFGDRFDASDLEAAAHFAPYYWHSGNRLSAGLRLKVRDTLWLYPNRHSGQDHGLEARMAPDVPEQLPGLQRRSTAL